MVDSTNSAATRLLAKSNPTEGTVLYADQQLAGRGQIGSQWQSPFGQNLLFSVILYPKFLLATQQFKLHQVVSLALYETLHPLLPHSDALRVKWPNDLYYNDQKMGGILIENSLKGTSIQHTIIGIGLNVNQTDFSPELTRATSLQIATGNTHDLTALLGTLCQQLERHYLALKNQRYQALETAYLQHLYRYQTWCSFRRKPSNQPFRGKIIGVSPTGLLQVQTATGVELFDLKGIAFEWEE